MKMYQLGCWAGVIALGASLVTAQVAAPEVIAYDGMELPGVPGAFFGLSGTQYGEFHGTLAVSPGGTIAFSSSTLVPGEWERAAVFRVLPGLGSALVARVGDTVDGPPHNGPWRISSTNMRTLAINNRGDMLFLGLTQGAVGGNLGAAFLARAGGPVQTLFQGTGPVPGMDGWVFAEFGHLSAGACSDLTESGFAVFFASVSRVSDGASGYALMGLGPMGLRAVARFGSDQDADFQVIPNFHDQALFLDVNESGTCIFVGGGRLYRASLETGSREMIFDPAVVIPPDTVPPGAILSARINDAGTIALQAGTRVFVDRGAGFVREMYSGQIVGEGAGTRRVHISGSTSGLTLDAAGMCTIFVNLQRLEPPYTDLDQLAFLRSSPGGTVELSGIIGQGLGVGSEAVGFPGRNPALKSTSRAGKPTVVQAYAGSNSNTTHRLLAWDDFGDGSVLFAGPQVVQLPDATVRVVRGFRIIGFGPSFTTANVALTDDNAAVHLAQTENAGWVLLRATLPPASCGDADFNNDGVFPDSRDPEDFLAVFAGAPCPVLRCDTLDINRDGVYPDAADIDAFLSVFAGGACP